MLKSQKAKIIDTFIMLACGGVFICLYISLLDSQYYPAIVGDEVGYWTSSAYVNGFDWSGVMSNGGYYNWFYGIILAPFMALKDNPVIMYRAAMGLNVAFLFGSFILCKYIAGVVLPNNNKYLITIASFAVSAYPYFTVSLHYTWPEEMLSFLFWLDVLCVVKIVKKPTIFNSICFSILLIIGFATHMRMIGVLIAGCILMVTLLAEKKIEVKHVVAFAVTLFLLFVAATFIKELLLNAEYLNTSKAKGNDFAGQTSKILKLFSLEGIYLIVSAVLGRFFYIGCSSFLTIYFALYLFIRDVWSAVIKKKHEEASFFELKIFLLLSLFSGIGISAVSMIEPARIDTLIYGRYSENLIGPFLIIAVLCIKNIQLRQKVTIFAWTSVLQLITAWWLYSYFIRYDVSMYSYNSATSLFAFPSLFGNSIILRATISPAVFSIIVMGGLLLLSEIKTAKYLYVGVLAVIWLVIGVLYAENNITSTNDALVEQSQRLKLCAEKDTNVYYLFDEDIQHSIYCMYRLQFLCAGIPIKAYSINSYPDLSQFDDNDILLVYSGVKADEIFQKILCRLQKNQTIQFT